ncbi:MAG: hypothetical protein GY799_25405 [Desulfobulbaceae bacterium]|nr:hypothetical protein [Desulfobulbaceae bacterium]
MTEYKVHKFKDQSGLRFAVLRNGMVKAVVKTHERAVSLAAKFEALLIRRRHMIGDD